MPPMPGQFGEKRHLEAGVDLPSRLVEVGQSGVSLRALGGNRAGEVRFGRFLRCEAVTPAEMIVTAAAHTRSLVAGRHILAIQDTTSLRDGSAGAVHGNKRPFEEKESRRWLEAAQASATLRAADAAAVTMIGDREDDLYEDFALRPPEVEVLFRANHDRVLADGTWLFDKPRGRRLLGRETIALPAAPGRAARHAVLALRAELVALPRPRRNHPAEATMRLRISKLSCREHLE